MHLRDVVPESGDVHLTAFWKHLELHSGDHEKKVLLTSVQREISSPPEEKEAIHHQASLGLTGGPIQQ